MNAIKRYMLTLFLLPVYMSCYSQLSTISIEGKVISTSYRSNNDNKDAVIDTITMVENDNEFSEIKPIKMPKNKGIGSNISFPLKRIRTTSNYGYRFNPIRKEFKFHSGVDLKADNEAVYSFSSGVIEKSLFDNYSGLYVVVNHGKDIKSVYAHLSYIGVTVGQKVRAGELIAISGNTGMSTAPHLHFSIKYKDAPVDPRSVFRYIAN